MDTDLSDLADIVIEDGIPVPERHNKSNNKFRIACEKLEVGQSFVIKGSKHQDRARGAAARVGKRTGKVFTARHITGDTYRIWRVK